MSQSNEAKKILILDGRSDHYWLVALQETVSALCGSLEIVGEASIQHVSWHDYDLVILDVSVLDDVLSIISLIRSQYSQARIVVFSPAPSWKQAREVMLAGAADYARKAPSKEYIQLTLKKNLARKVPSWQYQRKPKTEVCDEECIVTRR